MKKPIVTIILHVCNCASELTGTPTTKQKYLTIVKALTSNPVDVITLKQCAISRGGLISDRLRAEAWPHLLAIKISQVDFLAGN